MAFLAQPLPVVVALAAAKVNWRNMVHFSFNHRDPETRSACEIITQTDVLPDLLELIPADPLNGCRGSLPRVDG
jgi:hypothetical protein